MQKKSKHFKEFFFQLRLKVDVNECTPANAVILLTHGKTPGAEGEVRISFVKELLEFQENTGGATLGVAGGAKGCLSGAGDPTPSHLWLQTLLCLPHLCPELSYCPSILFYPWTPQCLGLFSSCCFLLGSCFYLAQLDIDISPCLSSYCVCLGSLF